MNPLNEWDVALAQLSTTDPAGYFHVQWEDHYRRQQSGSLTDLLLLAGGLLVPVHQAVLLPVSHLLSQLVSLPCCWQTLPTVSLPGVDPASVLSMVRLVYTGRCNVSTGLEYYKLVNLLETLGIDIEQTLVSLDDAQLDQPLNLSVHNIKTEDKNDGDSIYGKVASDVEEGGTDCEKSVSTSFGYDGNNGNNGYCHKKFRASISPSPSSKNHTLFEPEIKLEYFPEENPENEIMNQNKNANQRISFPPSQSEKSGIMDAFDLMECLLGNGTRQGNLGANVPIENPCQLNQANKESYEGNNIQKPEGQFICTCERCGMQFLSDKLVSYILYQKECPDSKAGAGSNIEAADVNLSNAEAKTSMMSKDLECPHCDQICSSMVHYVDHLDTCQKNDYVWDVNSSKQLEIANEISIDEEELVDSPKADENRVDEELNNIRISSKSCQLCSDVFLPPYHLKMHYTERHFFRELSERVPSGNLICDICQRKFSCRKALILHIGATHEIALDLLSKKLQEDAEDCNKIRIYGDNNDSFDELIIDVDNDSPIMPQEMHEVKNCRLKCDICEMCFSTNYLLQVHYSTRHYNAELDAEYAGEYESKGGACPLCNKATKSLLQFILHIGAFHNEVSKYRGMSQKESSNSRCYTCPLSPCRLQFPQKSHLVRHLSTSHYLNEVNTLAMSFWINHKTCPMCQKLFSDFVLFRIHLSVTHNMIEKFYSKNVKEYLASLPTKKRKFIKEEDSKASQNRKIKSEVEAQVFVYSCHRCDKRFPNLTYLLNHLTLVHYRQKLTSKFAKAMKTNVCNICKVKIESTDSNKMLRHIGVTHRRVLSCLPKDVSEKLNEKTSERAKMCFDERHDTKNKSKVSTFNESLVKNEDTNSPSEARTGDLASPKQDERMRPKVLLKGEDRLCKMCDNESRTLSALLLHLTTTHFRSNLRKEFLISGEKFPKQCPICQKKMLTTTSFLSHVGTTHRKVIEYTPWIEESSEGELWFSSKNGASSYREAEEAKRSHFTPNRVSHIRSNTLSPKPKIEACDLNQNKKARHAAEALKPFHGEYFFTTIDSGTWNSLQPSRAIGHSQETSRRPHLSLFPGDSDRDVNDGSPLFASHM